MRKSNLESITISDSISFIQDGVNAAHIIASCQDEVSGITINEDKVKAALEWVFDKLDAEITDLQEQLAVCDDNILRLKLFRKEEGSNDQ